MVQSLERAFAILDEVAQRPAGVTSIAERVRLPKSTVARLLATLEDVDAVERFDGVRWRIGPGVAALTAPGSPERNLIAIAHPFLVDLVGELGEDAGLGLPDGNEVHYVDQVESDNPVQVRDWTGTRAPMHAVPSGLVLLAEWPEDALDAYLRGAHRSHSADGHRPGAPPKAPGRSPQGRLRVGTRGIRGRNRLGRRSDSRCTRQGDRGHPCARPLLSVPASRRGGLDRRARRRCCRRGECSARGRLRLERLGEQRRDVRDA